MAFLMKVFKALMTSKVVAALGFLATILGAIADPQWAGFIPDNLAALAVTLGAPIAWLGRQLVDVDGNGIPDLFDRWLGNDGSTGLRTVIAITVAGMALAGLLAATRMA